jgi:hypothetical protein
MQTWAAYDRFGRFLDHAHVADDQPGEGHVRVTWGTPDSGATDGWIDGTILFLPSDGESEYGSNMLDDGTPDPNAAWYVAETGQLAIVGLPGAPLTSLR